MQDPQVEHLLPHKDGKYPDRKFDWNNLFWSCSHCNNVKSSPKYDIGIVDCCKNDPELLLSFVLKGNVVEVRAINPGDAQAVLTAQLVEDVFTLSNTGLRVHKSAMRHQELTKEMNILYDNLEAIKKTPESKVVLRKLKAILRRESRFAAFKRDYVRRNQATYPQLSQYIV